MVEPVKTCTSLKKNGTRCGSLPVRGTERCWFHSVTKAKRREVQSAGGKKLAARRATAATRRKQRLDSPPVEFKTPDDVRKLLAETATDLRHESMDASQAKAIAAVAGVALRTFVVEPHPPPPSPKDGETKPEGGADPYAAMPTEELLKLARPQHGAAAPGDASGDDEPDASAH